MPIALSLGDLLKAVTEKKGSDKKVTQEWLIAVAMEADNLARAWTSLYAEYFDDPKAAKLPSKPLGQAILERNAPPYSRLLAFYKDASRALGGKYKYQEEVVQAMSRMIRSRAGLRGGFEKDALLRAAREAGEKVDREDLLPLVESLHKDAATLYAFAKSFR